MKQKNEKLRRLGISNEFCQKRDFRFKVKLIKVYLGERKGRWRIEGVEERKKEHVRRMKVMWRRNFFSSWENRRSYKFDMRGPATG